jgi:tRNA (guanine-N7-)-methyltransferase
MTNPLAKQHQVAMAAPDWNTCFPSSSTKDNSVSTRPLLLDLGCAKGRWLLNLASLETVSNSDTENKEDVDAYYNGKGWNFCGAEIYAPIVEKAEEDVKKLGLKNLKFLACNVNVSLESLRFPNPRVVCIQFPDPWHSGRKHIKRRLVNPAFAGRLTMLLSAGAVIYISSDVKELAMQIRDTLMSTMMYDAVNHLPHWVNLRSISLMRSPSLSTLRTAGEGTNADADQDLVDVTGDAHINDDPAEADRYRGSAESYEKVLQCLEEEGWLLGGNPFGVPTERDKVCEVIWRPVYRCILIRRASPRMDERVAKSNQEE